MTQAGPGRQEPTTAAARWGIALNEWAIPVQILAAAPVSPWSLSPRVLRQRVAEFAHLETPSRARALEVLPADGKILDVGVGAGAASLSLAGPAGLVVGVDEKQEMLEAFSDEASRMGVQHETLLGRWPQIESSAPVADVVVCHHVFYNVPDLLDFVGALSRHAGRRVVAEITESHPMALHNDMWLKWHGLRRPSRPTAADAVGVVREAGFEPRVDLWVRPKVARFEDRGELVAFVRTRLCLTADHDAEIDRVLEEDADVTPRGVATIWWDVPD